MAASRYVTAGSYTALLLLLGLVAGVLSGCGSTGKGTLSPSSPPPISAALPANWQFTGTITSGVWPTAIPGSVKVPIGVFLTGTDSAITGSANVQMASTNLCSVNCCGGPFAQFSNALSGTLNGTGVLTLTSTVPNGGPVFTMTATVAGITLTSGTFTLTGPCAAKGTITGVALASLDGSYAGTVTSMNTGQSYSLSTTLEQSTTINTRGFLDVSGAATLTGYPCLNSVSAALPLDLNSGILGNQFAVTMNSTDGATLTISGTLSQDGKTIAATYIASGGACKLDVGSGTLTLQ